MRSESEPTGSPTLLPQDHARMLVELLRPTGMELARRWLAALLCVPMSEREQVVAAIEARIAKTYLAGRLPSRAAEQEAARVEREAAEAVVEEPAAVEHDDDEQTTIRVVHPPTQKDGYVEQEFSEYAVKKEEMDAEDAGTETQKKDKKGKGKKRA